MLGCMAIALPDTEQIIPHLCGISTRQLELMLWRVMPNNPTFSSQCLSQMVSLNKRLWDSLYAILWQGKLHKVAAP